MAFVWPLTAFKVNIIKRKQHLTLISNEKHQYDNNLLISHVILAAAVVDCYLLHYLSTILRYLRYFYSTKSWSKYYTFYSFFYFL